MMKEERHSRICSIINENGSASVADLSIALNTSPATMRRDLLELDKQKRIKRTRGGAMPYYPVSEKGIDESRKKDNIFEKEAIAMKALEYINEGDTLFLDCSTTVIELAKLLSQITIPLTVITYSLEVTDLIKNNPNIQTIIVGGCYDANINATCGFTAENNLRQLRADKAFVGISGISQNNEFSTSSMIDAGLKLIVNSITNSIFVLADHTKFGKSLLTSIDIKCDTIITDKRINGFEYERLEYNEQIIYVNEN